MVYKKENENWKLQNCSWIINSPFVVQIIIFIIMHSNSLVQN